jgi:Asp-tRNA(Asn)/Glu-tRNA(Gln) amidotransferase A subunit family amidase
MYDIINRGNELTLAQYQVALKEQTALCQQLDQILSTRFDVILNLTTGGEALKGLESVDRPDNCLIWTLCHVPAINLPVFSGPNKLPFGAQIVGRRYNDPMLLSFAELLQRHGLLAGAPHPVPQMALSGAASSSIRA